MSSSEPISVLIQGELGSFSHEAAEVLLPEAKIVSCHKAVDIFGMMYAIQNTVALIPIENALAGSVLEFYDLLHQCAKQYKIKILREHQLRIRHNLIAKPGSKLPDPMHIPAIYPKPILVYSHPVALAQCRRFFEVNLHLRLRPVEFYDTAGAVKWMMEQQDADIAAIASKKAAEIYGGEILQAGIEDNPENYTRFLLLEFKNESNKNERLAERVLEGLAPPNKMSLILTLKNQPGALVEVLRIFADLKMNLTKIESRPIQGRPWEYLFYVDVLFPAEAAADEALQRLRPQCETILDLGRYKAAEPPTA